VKIAPHETQLIGAWISESRSVRGDAVCERIHRLTEHHLRKIAFSPTSGAWETLFQDPEDGRYWERTYPQGERHGGGPPALICLSRDEAKAKYGGDVA
jgi:hypothetical protein